MADSPEVDRILDELYEFGRREGVVWSAGPDIPRSEGTSVEAW